MKEWVKWTLIKRVNEEEETNRLKNAARVFGGIIRLGQLRFVTDGRYYNNLEF